MKKVRGFSLVELMITIAIIGIFTPDLQALGITDSLSYAFVRNATAVDKAQTAINVYTRVQGKGKANAIEWLSLMSVTPTLTKSIGDAFGKTSVEINEMGMQGNITAQMLNEGLLKSLEDNRAAADSMANTVTDGFTKLSNELKRTNHKRR